MTHSCRTWRWSQSKDEPAGANPEKKEFQDLWNRINRKAAYTVHFETNELVEKCVKCLDKELKVSQLQYTIQQGEQTSDASFDAINQGEAFKVQNTTTESLQASIQSAVKYDLLLAEQTQLTRKTVADILQGISVAIFGQYKTNPEDFILKAARLINEQKATVIVEHLAYDPVDETHSSDIFTQEKPKEDFSKAVKAERHIYDYVFTDSKNERTFVKELDSSTEVVVYAKLPKSFFIPRLLGITTQTMHSKRAKLNIYFIAETKGSMSSWIWKVEECKLIVLVSSFRIT